MSHPDVAGNSVACFMSTSVMAVFDLPNASCRHGRMALEPSLSYSMRRPVYTAYFLALGKFPLGLPT